MQGTDKSVHKPYPLRPSHTQAIKGAVGALLIEVKARINISLLSNASYALAQSYKWIV